MRNGMLYKVMLVMICGLLFAGCAGGPAKQEAQTSTLEGHVLGRKLFFQPIWRHVCDEESEYRN